MLLSKCDEIWAILVRYCGASEDGLSEFRRTMLLSDSNRMEYRFQGSLGFGGKLWIDPYNVRVSCYPEDVTPERSSAIDFANIEIHQLFPRYLQSNP